MRKHLLIILLAVMGNAANAQQIIKINRSVTDENMVTDAEVLSWKKKIEYISKTVTSDSVRQQNLNAEVRRFTDTIHSRIMIRKLDSFRTRNLSEDERLTTEADETLNHNKDLFLLSVKGTTTQKSADSATLYLISLSRTRTRQQNVNPLSLSSLASNLSSFSAVAIPGETQIVGNIGFKLKKTGINLYNITITAPITGRKTEPVTLDGLANKASVGIGGYYEFWRKSIRNDDSCFVNTFNRLRKTWESNCCNGREIEMDELTPQQLAQIQDQMVIKLHLWFLGWNAKIAKKDYDYIDAVQARQSASKYDYQAKVFGGYRATNKFALAFTATFQSSNSGGDFSTYSFPVAGGVTRDYELYEQAPTRSTNFSLKGEMRWVSNSSKFAVNPYLAVDVTRGILEARLPLYFFQVNGEDGIFKGVNGGVFFGYLTNRDFDFQFGKSNIQVGVVFGSLFDINQY
jgi:hypothetical protein